MATKEKTRRFHFPGRDTVRMSRKSLMGAAESGVGFLLGAVLSGAQVFGLYSPFGVAAVAAAGSGVTGFCTLAGACLGYLCLGGMTDGMRYAASAILTYSVAFAFFDTKVYRKLWFMPAIAALLCTITGVICRAGRGWRGEDLVFFATEILFTAVAAYFYNIIFRQWPETLNGPYQLSAAQSAGLLVLGGSIFIALSRVEILGTFSLGRLMAALTVMVCARRGPAAGTLAGASAGIAMDLASGESPYYSMIFALSGLVCGLCHKKGKFPAALAYVLANGIAVLWTWSSGMRVGLLYEVFVASILFLLIPNRVKEAAGQVLAPPKTGREEFEGAKQAVVRKVQSMAVAFRELYGSIRENLRLEESNPENPAEIFTRTADKVCVRCAICSICWQRDYQSTRAALNDATPQVLERGRALPTDFPGLFGDRCVHFTEFLAEVNRELTIFLRRRQALRRTRETRKALCSQYAKLDQVMSRAAAELSSGLTPDLPRQERLQAFLRERSLEGNGVVYYDKGGHLRVETPAAEVLRGQAEQRELSGLLGTTLREPEEENGRFSFAQAEPFRALACVAGKPKKGETVSGDTGTWFRREDGMLFLLLCDGMGSGSQARRESEGAMHLIEGFLKAGMEPEDALETVGSALALRGEGGCSTTVDLLSVDLFSGRCCIHKQGGATSYVRRNNQVKCAVSHSLPAGVLLGEQAKPDAHRFRGEKEDWIVLITDGVLCGREDDWLKDLIRQYGGTSPGELAEKILQESEGKNQGEDDATVIAVRLEKRKGG